MAAWLAIVIFLVVIFMFAAALAPVASVRSRAPRARRGRQYHAPRRADPEPGPVDEVHWIGSAPTGR
jgi:hypothetical protein